MLEAQVALAAEIVRGLRVADDDDVLDPDAVATVLVVPRFYEQRQIETQLCEREENAHRLRLSFQA